METDDEEPRGVYVPALVIESPTTPRQRARNYALYQRLRDGTPPEQRTGSRDGVGLHVFVFDVPIERLAIHRDSFSFRLDKDDECYRRLLSYITDHFDARCDADDEVERLTRENADQAKLIDELRTALVTSIREREKLSDAAIETLGQCNDLQAEIERLKAVR